MEALIPIFAIGILFLGLPWLVFHYITQWKRSGSLSLEDENLLDELHDLARRLDERLGTIERITAADNPGWRPRLSAEEPAGYDPSRSPERIRTEPGAH